MTRVTSVDRDATVRWGIGATDITDNGHSEGLFYYSTSSSTLRSRMV